MWSKMVKFLLCFRVFYLLSLSCTVFFFFFFLGGGVVPLTLDAFLSLKRVHKVLMALPYQLLPDTDKRTDGVEREMGPYWFGRQRISFVDTPTCSLSAHVGLYAKLSHLFGLTSNLCPYALWFGSTHFNFSFSFSFSFVSLNFNFRLV